MKWKKECGVEKREALGEAYWKDKRWERVKKLRNRRQNVKANGLVLAIRESWGL